MPTLDPTPDTALAILRQNRQLAQFNQESSARRQAFHLMASEGERIAWLQRRIDELEALASAAPPADNAPTAASPRDTPGDADGAA